MSNAENQTGDLSGPADHPLVRWRPWPCESCRGSPTALDFLVRCLDSSPQIPDLERNQQIDWLKKSDADLLLGWIRGCPHTQWLDMVLPRLDEGSEHLVLFDAATSEVVKITRPGTYGDYYEIVDNRISQFDSTPAEYLIRMSWWELLFSAAPAPMGMTETGQIVSRQQFIRGDPPTQEMVDQFLLEAGLDAVRKSCWLWKKLSVGALTEIWIGDARADNFVSAEKGIIPIDIRIWGV